MLTYLIRHCGTRGIQLALGALAVVAVSAGATGCAGQAPEVKVLGVTQPKQPVAEQRILVFVEVVNPGYHDLELSRLEYRFRASSWFKSEGHVALARQVAPGASAIVEIPVPVKGAPDEVAGGVPFSLEGKLFARDDRLERSWTVKAKGALRNAQGPKRSVQIRVAAASR